MLPERQTMRVLGLWLQSNKRASYTIKVLKCTVKNIARMIHRITRKGKGLNEGETLRLVQAFVLSRVTYGLPYQELTPTEIKEIDLLIRGAYKAALGIPLNASNQKVEALGVYNTFEELAAATLLSQKERLCLTKVGRETLIRLGYPTRPQYCKENITTMARETRQHITVCPIPRNMSKLYHGARRQARARQLQKQFGQSHEVVYTDAAKSSQG